MCSPEMTNGGLYYKNNFVVVSKPRNSILGGIYLLGPLHYMIVFVFARRLSNAPIP